MNTFCISKMFVILFAITLVSTIVLTSGTPKFYKAAVYEHKVILPPETPVSRDAAVGHMMENLKIFDIQAMEASDKGVDIIVFPEDGIYEMRWNSRDVIKPYLEYMPEIGVQWNPCLQPNLYKQTEVQHFLSCLARKSSIYIVANMGDKQPCDRDVDPKCPPDGQYQYNTDIVYDPVGNYVTKYHKYSLFYESQFDRPSTYEIISFQTPFGKFGLITCFDVLFQHPALDLIVRQNITNIAFPTAWMDAEPFLSAIQFHSAFANGLGINFLAANIHFPIVRFHGSGLYTPNGAASYYYNSSIVSDGKLLIATIPVIEKPKFTQLQHFALPVKDSLSHGNVLTFNPSEFQEVLFHDSFTLIPLSAKASTSEVCQNSLCCKVTYEQKYKYHIKDKHSDRSLDVENEYHVQSSEYYALGVFDGLHTYQGKYYMQVCTLIRCKQGLFSRTCGQALETDSTTLEMEHFTMSGNFSTDFIYPEVLLSGNGLKRLPSYPNKWIYRDNILSAKEPFESTLTVASLFGRAYGNDTGENA